MSKTRKIYTKVVMDMRTGETVEEESYLYDGPVALCDGQEGDVDEGNLDVSGEPDGGDQPDDYDDADYGDGPQYEDGDEGDEEDAANLKSQVEYLQRRLEELTELTTTNQQGEQEAQIPQYESQEFIQSDDDLDNVLNSREGLNKLMNSAVQTALQHFQQSIPGVVKNNVAQQIQLQETVSNFYSENPELKRHRSFVGKVSERIMSENPDWSMQKVLEETAKEARTRLKLKQKADSKKSDPGFAKGGRGGKSKSKQKLSSQEAQIADMLSVDEL